MDQGLYRRNVLEDEDKRGAYADDVVERTRNEEEASVSLQQFEASGVWRLRFEYGQD